MVIKNMEQFNNAKSRDYIDILCKNCGKEFKVAKNQVQANIKRKKGEYCSYNCSWLAQKTKQKVNCKQCNKEFSKLPNQIKKSKNHFCSLSCNATYQNNHKTTGTRRSKLEIWLEIKLKELYPDLEIKFNDRKTINAELDIYFPTLKIAFELNGIFHYEPIFGENKLNQTQNNDNRKILSCAEQSISLCVIDVSWIRYHKESNSQKILDIIINILANKLEATT